MKLEEEIEIHTQNGCRVELYLEEGLGVMVISHPSGYEEHVDLGEMGGDMAPYLMAGAEVIYNA